MLKVAAHGMAAELRGMKPRKVAKKLWKGGIQLRCMCKQLNLLEPKQPENPTATSSLHAWAPPPPPDALSQAFDAFLQAGDSTAATSAQETQATSSFATSEQRKNAAIAEEYAKWDIADDCTCYLCGVRPSTPEDMRCTACISLFGDSGATPSQVELCMMLGGLPESPSC